MPSFAHTNRLIQLLRQKTNDIWIFFSELNGGVTARSTRRQSNSLLEYGAMEPRVCMAPLVPFSNEGGVLHQIHGVSGEQGQLSSIDLVNKSFSHIGEHAGFKINATGFRTADGFIYGIKMDTDELIRIGAEGKHEVLGPIGGLPEGNYFTGDFASDGRLYVRHKNTFYGINVDSCEVERQVTSVEDVRKTYDIAYNPETGLHYSVRKNGRSAEFISIDLMSESGEANVEVINDDFRPVGTFGAVFSDASGRVFAANNAGGLYEIDLESGEATFAGYSPRASSNDGAFSSDAYVNLPPVATDRWMSTLVGGHVTELGISAPYDLEGDTLSVTATSLPSLGEIRNSSGQLIQTGQALTLEELSSLQYRSPESVDSSDDDAVAFLYEVSDGTQTVTGRVDINFAGSSRITGQVVVVDDTEESAYEGYVLNNEIRLTGEDLLGNEVEQIVYSNIHGRFEFSSVPPGEYQIEQIQPQTVFDDEVSIGNLPGTPVKNGVVKITIPSDPQSFDGLTFYEEAPSQFSGFVYVDENGNGRIDVDERGIPNVEIQLDGTDNTGESVGRRAMTDSYGYYEFKNVRSGNYRLIQSQPDGYVSATTNVGDLGGNPSTDQVDDIVISAGERGNRYHFGEYETSSIAGSVFVDNDIDNNFDSGDIPLTDLTVDLSGIDFLGNQVVRQIKSNSEGHFLFDDLVAGVYNIEVDSVEGLSDGKAHIGVFDNDETVLDSNGLAETTRITGIKVDFGRDGRSFNFSKRPSYCLVKQFDEYVVFEGTETEDEFEFVAGETVHQVNFNGVLYEFDANQKTHFAFNGSTGVDQVQIHGTNRVEQVVVSEFSGTYLSENWSFQFEQSERVTVYSGGGYDRAFIYDTPQDDRIKMTQDYSRLWNDDFVVETRGFHRTYAYAENGGEDRVYHYDSKYDDTVKMTSENSRMISRKFYNFARGFERNYAFSVNGGTDRAQFWDSSADRDVFEANPEYGRLYNDGFYNLAKGFEQLDVFGVVDGGNNDRAFLNGSEGEDILLASPAKSGLSGNGYKYDVHSFERVYAYGGGGQDRAYLFDSKLDDRFVAGPTEAKLFNDHYFLKVHDFSQVDAYSSKGGNDRAYFDDSEGDDTLISLENETRMMGDGFDNCSHGFARTYARAFAGGNDRALLYDTQHADTIKISEQVSKMYGENYYTWLAGFNDVSAQFAKANRYDRALVFGEISQETLSQSGELAQLVYDHAAEFVHDPDADDQDEYGPDEHERASILELLADFELDKD